MDESFANPILAISLTMIFYMGFPLIKLWINQGKFEKKKAKKIALWNSIIVGGCFFILSFLMYEGGVAWSAAPAVTYYFINRAILTDKNPEEEIPPFEIDKCNFCRKCGEKLIDNGKFCRKCGTKAILIPTVAVIEAEDWDFCKKCGADITNDVDRCHVCGEPKNIG